MKIVCTGGSGFIGTNVISKLITSGHTVLNMDIRSPRNCEHKEFWQNIDIRDKESFSSSLEEFQPEVILHLAARTDLHGKSLSDYSANFEGVQNLCNTIKKIPAVKRVIFISSRLVCKIGYQPISEDDYCPTTLYGESKALGEKFTRKEMANSIIDWLILRPTSIWGPWFGTPYKEFFYSILRQRYVHPRGLSVLKSFGYVGNSVYLLNELIQNIPERLKKTTLYLCDYEPIDVLSWAKEIASMANVKPPSEVPDYVLRSMAKAGDFLKVVGVKEPPLTTFRLNNIKTDMVYDTTLLRNYFSSLPYSQSEGIKMTLDWIQSRSRQNEAT